MSLSQFEDYPMKPKQIMIMTIAAISLFPIMATAQTSAGKGQGMGQGRGIGQGMVERFTAIDSDGNGMITAKESADWQASVFSAMDADDDARLTLEEFMSVQMGRGADPEMRGPKFAQKQGQKNKRFKAMDLKNSGYVSKETFLKNGKARFVSGDTNADGSLSMVEFRASRQKR